MTEITEQKQAQLLNGKITVFTTNALTVNQVDSLSLELAVRDDLTVTISCGPDDYSTCSIQFPEEHSSLVSPRISGSAEGDLYRCRPSDLPVESNGHCLYNYMLFQISGGYIRFRIKTDSSYEISLDKSEKESWKVDFDGAKLELQVTLTKSLETHLLNTVSESELTLILPGWAHATGFIIEHDSGKTAPHSLTGLESEYGLKNPPVLVSNWGLSHGKSRESGRIDIESLLHRIKIADMPAILEVSTRVPESEFSSIPVMRTRNGEIISSNNSLEIDYFHDEGKAALKSVMKSFLDTGCDGLFINTPYARFADSDSYSRAICKSRGRHIEYKKHVLQGQQILNSIMNEVIPTKATWASSLCSPVLQGSIYLHNGEKRYLDLLYGLYERYLQGFINSGVVFRIDNEHLPARETVRVVTLLMLAARPLFFSLPTLKSLTGSNKLHHDLYSKLVSLRAKLIPHYRQALRNYLDKGKIPVVPVKYGDETGGFIIGDSLLTAFVDEHFLQKSILIPEGTWYSMEQNRFITGPGKFSISGGQDRFFIFYREQSISVHYPGTAKPGIIPLSLEFILYIGNDKMTEKIVEEGLSGSSTCTISHELMLEISGETGSITYNQSGYTGPDRYIMFTLILTTGISEISINKKNSRASMMNTPGKTSIECKTGDKPVTIQFTIAGKG
jgi:hypothetical protein